jgi:hypothetical protein
MDPWTLSLQEINAWFKIQVSLNYMYNPYSKQFFTWLIFNNKRGKVMCNGTEHTALISFATEYFYLI